LSIVRGKFGTLYRPRRATPESKGTVAKGFVSRDKARLVPAAICEDSDQLTAT
jgi:hypothetical protein